MLDYYTNQLNMQYTLPKELLYHIMLELNINEIKNLCFTNYGFFDICDDIHFWKQKFDQDGLVYVDLPDLNIFKLYEAAYKSTKIMYLIDNKILLDTEKTPKYISFTLKGKDFTKIIGYFHSEIFSKKLNIRINFRQGQIIITTRIKTKNMNADVTEHINEQKLYYILTKLFYYYPNKHIFDKYSNNLHSPKIYNFLMNGPE